MITPKQRRQKQLAVVEAIGREHFPDRRPDDVRLPVRGRPGPFPKKPCCSNPTPRDI
jgi:hypothetical protein